MQGAFAIALTLVDQDTPACLSPATSQADTAATLRFHCSCPLVEDPAAAFATAASVGDLGPLDRSAPGTADYPDRTATVILQVADLFPREPAGPRQPSRPGRPGPRGGAGGLPGPGRPFGVRQGRGAEAHPRPLPAAGGEDPDPPRRRGPRPGPGTSATPAGSPPTDAGLCQPVLARSAPG